MVTNLNSSYTCLADKTAYTKCADPDQTAHKGAVKSGFKLFALPHRILRVCETPIKIGTKVWNKVIEI